MATGGIETNADKVLGEKSEPEHPSTPTPGEAYRSRVWEDLRNLFQQDHLIDVMLAAEGQSIPCHKVLLAAASKFFHGKFITHPEALEHNILDIDGIGFDTLRSVVAYIYSGNIELTVENTEKLIPASDSLMLPELTRECENFLEQMNTDTSVCVAVYKLAKDNSLENIAQKAWDVMLDKFQDITTTDAFKELSETEVQKYIGNKDLNVASEDLVFEAVVTWVRHDMENRKDSFESLVKNVTLSYCSLSFLRDTVLQEALMKRGNCFQNVAGALASQATCPSLQPGTPRKMQHGNNFLVAICDDRCWVLNHGELEWKKKNSVAGKIMIRSRACRTGDGILAAGGWHINRKFSKQCCKLSFPTLDWTAVPDLNVARYYHASVCGGEQVYVLGGQGDSGVLRSVEYLDKKTGSWCVTTDMPKTLYGHTAVNYKHYIYVFGGWSKSHQESQTSLVFNTCRKTWSKKTNMPQSCTEGSSVVYRDRIYLLGGKENCCFSYNPDLDCWQTHSRPKKDHNGGSAVVWGDRILRGGGYFTTVIEEYKPDTDTWTDWEQPLPQQAACSMFAIQFQ